ncbi:hypothetical protein CSA37_05770 [Candidatus Fermentibacteria bacterium]|nr:MAG: hypothetical protein CSA37_13240 [Candidatus Fermentibacteria bacterium]PIE52591.1 MAG: hypothetical protein CSA37_05770 [Candidatus Fermentibacteria bacterium]
MSFGSNWTGQVCMAGAEWDDGLIIKPYLAFHTDRQLDTGRNPLKGRVLIIDHEARVRRNLTAGLTEEGYFALACADGISAIHELNQARSMGLHYDYLITGILLPDINGLKFLKTIRKMCPELPALVLSRFGDEDLPESLVSEQNTGYLTSSFETSDVVQALSELPSGSTATCEEMAVSHGGISELSRAFLNIKLTGFEKNIETFSRLYSMKNSLSCHALRGDVDVLLQIQAESGDEIESRVQEVRAIEGVDVLSVATVEKPELDSVVEQFLNTYRKVVTAKERSQKRTDPASCIFVDIMPERIQQIFTTAFFIDQTVQCEVVDKGAGLICILADCRSAGRTPEIIEKLSQLEGVLRVREAKIISLMNN